MKLRTADDIRRHALSHGAEVEIGGRAFNASHQRVAAKPEKAPEKAAPAPAAAPALTSEDVVRIAAQMLAESERRTARALAEQANAFTLAVAKALREAPQPAPGRVLVRQQVKVTYDADDRITGMSIEPVYKE